METLHIPATIVDTIRAAVLVQNGHAHCGGEDLGTINDVLDRTTSEINAATRIALLGGDWYCLRVRDEAVYNYMHSSDKRAKNWVARVRSNRMAPGGLDRDFLRRGSSACVSAEEIVVGDVLEFAGDEYSSRGTKYAKREYVKVMARGDGFIAVEDCTPGGKLKPSRKIEMVVA